MKRLTTWGQGGAAALICCLLVANLVLSVPASAQAHPDTSTQTTAQAATPPATAKRGGGLIGIFIWVAEKTIGTQIVNYYRQPMCMGYVAWQEWKYSVRDIIDAGVPDSAWYEPYSWADRGYDNHTDTMKGGKFYTLWNSGVRSFAFEGACFNLEPPDEFPTCHDCPEFAPIW